MLSDENLERYARQAIMPDIGEEGQERLLESRMLVVGAGGLGSPTIFYLAAAGVGNLTIMDSESVDLTNLNRQILHTTASIGSPKVTQAAATVAALNPSMSRRSPNGWRMKMSRRCWRTPRCRQLMLSPYSYPYCCRN